LTIATRSRQGVAMRVFLPTGNRPVAGLVTAAQHGEEAVTALLARRLMERVHGDQTAWAVVPVVNPDGLLAGTRQNDAGVDLNRNFPAATWLPDASFTYPPGIAEELRRPQLRTNESSPGDRPGSEPETRALMALIERLIGLDAHAGRRIVPMCFQAETLGAFTGVPMSGDVASPLFQGAPQRSLYPDSRAQPSPASVATFLRTHGIDYIYADARHPNTFVPDATTVATSADVRILAVP